MLSVKLVKLLEYSKDIQLRITSTLCKSTVLLALAC